MIQKKDTGQLYKFHEHCIVELPIYLVAFLVLFLYIGVHGTFYDYFSYSYVLLFMKALVCIFKLNLN